MYGFSFLVTMPLHLLPYLMGHHPSDTLFLNSGFIYSTEIEKHELKSLRFTCVVTCHKLPKAIGLLKPRNVLLKPLS